MKGKIIAVLGVFRKELFRLLTLWVAYKFAEVNSGSQQWTKMSGGIPFAALAHQGNRDDIPVSPNGEPAFVVDNPPSREGKACYVADRP